MKRGGLLETQQASDLGDAQIAVAQVFNCRVAPQLVLDALVTRAFGVESPTQRGRSQIKFLGQFFQQGPLALRHTVTQPAPQARGPAVLVAVFQEHRLGRAAQELLDRGFVLQNGRTQ